MSAPAPGRHLWWGVSLIVLGVLLGWLVRAAVPITLVIAWAIALAGLAHLMVAHHSRRAYSLIWRCVGFAYLLFGVYLIAYPGRDLVSLILALALLFLFEGAFEILTFYRLRTTEGSNWILFKGIVSLILGLMFYVQWSPIARWEIGVLVGNSLIASGLTLEMSWLATRGGRAVVPGARNRDGSSEKEYWKIHS